MKKLGMRIHKSALLVDQVSEVLTNAILQGTLKSGEKLTETRLQEQFNVSRTPLREALRVLEKRGLVEILPRRGAYVKKISRKHVEDNFPVRAVLEGLAAKLTMIRKDPQVIKSLKKAQAGMERAVAENNPSAYTTYHMDFHESYIQGSGNEELIALISRVRMHATWHRYYFKFHAENFAAFLTGHTYMLEMFSNPITDPGYVEHYVKKSIMITQKQFLKYIDENDNS